ncbi:unnamed protein product, partial [Anisakis simplex]|uniref:TDP43_N domain-containing protein n=1 Tax=Anisakis simplex TaxID=6269 RepID=A0A0M3KB16_ANISI
MESENVNSTAAAAGTVQSSETPMESENVNSTAAAAAAGTVQSSETPMEVKCAKAESAAAAAASAKESAAIIDYVLVAENDDPTTDRMELPTQPEDGSLGLSTLTHAYPGAQGLKYKNPQTGASRALLVDSSGTRFMPPSGGWADKVEVEGSEANNPKRKKLMDEDDGISDDGTEGRGFSGGGSKQKRFDSSVDVTTSDSASGGGDMTVEHERAGAVCVDLIVLGISYKASEQTVKAYFETYGEVVMFD